MVTMPVSIIVFLPVFVAIEHQLVSSSVLYSNAMLSYLMFTIV